MSKRKNKNPVARVMNDFNKSQTHRDRKNDYKRKAKHEKRDNGPFSFGDIIQCRFDSLSICDQS